jgi:RNA polymerase sigma factor (TIGR02999 family)
MPQGQPAAALTTLVEAARGGDSAARDLLFAAVYEELLAIARRSRFVGRAGQTLQPTALVNEAYLQLSRRFAVPEHEDRSGREVFFTSVAFAMRKILSDHWRAKTAEKRGGGAPQLRFQEGDAPGIGTDELDPVDFVALDAALDRLAQYNPRWHQIVMHRYFAARTLEETAELLDLAVSTVKVDWQLARAWLLRAVGGGLP